MHRFISSMTQNDSLLDVPSSHLKVDLSKMARNFCNLAADLKLDKDEPESYPYWSHKKSSEPRPIEAFETSPFFSKQSNRGANISLTGGPTSLRGSDLGDASLERNIDGVSVTNRLVMRPTKLNMDV